MSAKRASGGSRRIDAGVRVPRPRARHRPVCGRRARRPCRPERPDGRVRLRVVLSGVRDDRPAGGGAVGPRPGRLGVEPGREQAARRRRPRATATETATRRSGAVDRTAARRAPTVRARRSSRPARRDFRRRVGDEDVEGTGQHGRLFMCEAVLPPAGSLPAFDVWARSADGRCPSGHADERWIAIGHRAHRAAPGASGKSPVRRRHRPGSTATRQRPNGVVALPSRPPTAVDGPRVNAAVARPRASVGRVGRSSAGPRRSPRPRRRPPRRARRRSGRSPGRGPRG